MHDIDKVEETIWCHYGTEVACILQTQTFLGTFSSEKRKHSNTERFCSFFSIYF